MPVTAPPTTSGASSYASGSGDGARVGVPASGIDDRLVARPGGVVGARQLDERRERLDVHALDRRPATARPVA